MSISSGLGLFDVLCVYDWPTPRLRRELQLLDVQLVTSANPQTRQLVNLIKAELRERDVQATVGQLLEHELCHDGDADESCSIPKQGGMPSATAAASCSSQARASASTELDNKSQLHKIGTSAAVACSNQDRRHGFSHDARELHFSEALQQQQQAGQFAADTSTSHCSPAHPGQFLTKQLSNTTQLAANFQHQVLLQSEQQQQPLPPQQQPLLEPEDDVHTHQQQLDCSLMLRALHQQQQHLAQATSGNSTPVAGLAQHAKQTPFQAAQQAFLQEQQRLQQARLALRREQNPRAAAAAVAAARRRRAALAEAVRQQQSTAHHQAFCHEQHDEQQCRTQQQRNDGHQRVHQHTLAATQQQKQHTLAATQQQHQHNHHHHNKTVRHRQQEQHTHQQASLWPEVKLPGVPQSDTHVSMCSLERPLLLDTAATSRASLQDSNIPAVLSQPHASGPNLLEPMTIISAAETEGLATSPPLAAAAAAGNAVVAAAAAAGNVLVDVLTGQAPDKAASSLEVSCFTCCMLDGVDLLAEEACCSDCRLQPQERQPQKEQQPQQSEMHQQTHQLQQQSQQQQQQQCQQQQLRIQPGPAASAGQQSVLCQHSMPDQPQQCYDCLEQAIPTPSRLSHACGLLDNQQQQQQQQQPELEQSALAQSAAVPCVSHCSPEAIRLSNCKQHVSEPSAATTAPAPDRQPSKVSCLVGAGSSSNHNGRAGIQVPLQWDSYHQWDGLREGCASENSDDSFGAWAVGSA